MVRCAEALLIGILLGVFMLGAMQWAYSRGRRLRREAQGWHRFVGPLMSIEVAPVSVFEIRHAVAMLADEEGLNEQWEERFVSVIRSRVRTEGYATLDHAISLLRMELVGY